VFSVRQKTTYKLLFRLFNPVNDRLKFHIVGPKVLIYFCYYFCIKINNNLNIFNQIFIAMEMLCFL
jgi:hypothetical protein